jgi:hypothetical protein
MASKTEYVVIDGCIQDGHTVTVKGERYSPATKEIAAELLAQGRIALIADPLLEAGDGSGESKANEAKIKPPPVQQPIVKNADSDAGA